MDAIERLDKLVRIFEMSREALENMGREDEARCFEVAKNRVEIELKGLIDNE